MQLCLPEQLDQAWPKLCERLDGAGFDLLPAGEAGWRVRSRAGGCQAWLTVEPLRDSVQVTLWLPDEGDPEQREGLVAAIDGGQGSGETTDESILRRLRRIEGQVRGVQRMVESGRECDALLTQMAAATAALRQTAALMVSEHLVECIRAEIDSGADVATVNQRLLKVLF